MSPANRGTQWANSGMVVEILPEDVPGDPDDPLRMMHYQEEIEHTFFEAAGRTQQAPAQRMLDFTQGRQSDTLPAPHIPRGSSSAAWTGCYPPPSPVASRKPSKCSTASSAASSPTKPYSSATKRGTSSPVRIPRDPDTLTHITHTSLYPCGEGAGYAGGIVSAAIDGIMTARALAAKIHSDANTQEINSLH